jgi:hypothetical protein
MARRRVEDEIETLDALRTVPPGDALPALRKALSARVGLVAAKAAKIAAELELHELVPELLRAFHRLLQDGPARDPQCWGKNAIASALGHLEHRESEVYLLGMRHIQMEPVWGGEEDTAVTLRGICLLSLAACADLPRPEILRALVDGLTDRAQTVRLEAVRALEQMEGDEAALLLRLKAGAGDPEPRVVGQVFDSLLALEGPAAFDFVAARLHGPETAAREEAALALGASRHPEAIERLQQAWMAARDPDLRYTLLRALSASRLDAALDFLIDIACHGSKAEIRDAIEALSLHSASPEIRRRLATALEDAGATAQEEFRRCFP